MGLLTAWRAAQLGELVWDTPDGPDALPVVPLSDDGVACVALPYAELARADALAAAGTAVACVSGPDLAGGAELIATRVRVRRIDDVDGEHFETSQLLMQELAKHPPSRRRLDSILLRREHWWFLPRILLHLTPVDDPRPLAPSGALLGRRGASGPSSIEVASVTIASRSGTQLLLEASAASASAASDGAMPAVVLEHGAEPPDLERTWGTRTKGTLEGAQLTVGAVDRWGRADRMPTLIQRVRDEWALERACIAGLRAHGRSD
jgi:hypothetical protein